MVKISEKTKVIKKLQKFIVDNNIDGYVVPKNDNYFTEYSKVNNLIKISNFTGSAGFALILKNKNYLFVDGRYTTQAKKQSGEKFIICEIPFIWPKNIKSIKNKKIGFDPKLFTNHTLNNYFKDLVNLVPINFDFESSVDSNINKFFKLTNSVVGESAKSKINTLKKFLKLNKIKYLYVSASENVCWLLNIRGKDLPNSPIANCKLIFTNSGKIYLLTNLKKISNLKKKDFKNISFYDESFLFQIINNFKDGDFCIDKNTCSVFDETIIKSKFKIVSQDDPIYNFKSLKNEIEINNTRKAHIIDGVAVTKFLCWFKNRKNKTNEKEIEYKLEKFRKKSKKYLYPSFDTIAGSGPNGAIIHYKSNNKTNRTVNLNDILLLDSGGQYKWGTTDITRTTCSGLIPNNIKNNFTRVLKGHIAVATCNLKKNSKGYLIDKLARKPLVENGLNYSHGTGHGVGFFLNVHEGPQGISKYNNILIKKGMILSNEPGLYLKNKYGIRIENLIYVDSLKNKLVFKNLTLAPIDLDMVNFSMLTAKERNYLFDYHLDVYAKISKYLNKHEKRWLLKLIK